MKMRSKQVPQNKAKVKLRAKLIYAGAGIAIIGIAIFFIVSYLNFGMPNTALAASTNISGIINSYVRATNMSVGE